MADQAITTSIDDLVKYINEHGESESTTLANALSVNEGIVETWAGVLEKAQIIKINYKMGKMYVSPMTATKEGAEIAKKTIEMKKGVAETELATQINMINQINAKLDEFKRYVAGSETAFKTKAGTIKEEIEYIDKLNSRVDLSYKKLKEKKDFVDGLAVRMSKKTKELEERTKANEAVTAKDTDSRRIISDIVAKLDDSEGRLRTLSKNFSRMEEENRKSFSDLILGIRSETGALREIVGQQEKEVSDYTSSVSSFKKESTSIKREVAKESSRMVDEIARASEEVRKVNDVAEKQVNVIKRGLVGLKNQFGGFADLSNRLNDIKNNIDSISKQKDELQKSLDELNLQMKALSVVEETKIVEKGITMQKAEEKMAESAVKIQGLNSELDAVKKDMDDIVK